MKTFHIGNRAIVADKIDNLSIDYCVNMGFHIKIDYNFDGNFYTTNCYFFQYGFCGNKWGGKKNEMEARDTFDRVSKFVGIDL